jgi:predicted nucleotide-binding protein
VIVKAFVDTMKKSKTYDRTKFSPEVIHKALEELEKSLSEEDIKRGMDYHRMLQVQRGNERWGHDTDAEFFADYRSDDTRDAYYEHIYPNSSIDVSYRSSPPISSEVRVSSTKRDVIERVFKIFEDSVSSCSVPEPQWESMVRIFIGHGRNLLWRDLKDHLQDKHDFEVITYETGARAGHEIRDVLEEMLNKSSFAILVFTGENEDLEGKLHARENVIHELGLFQGKLGSRKAIVLLEEGVEKFSNIDGVQYLSFQKDNIKETYGDIIATIKREFYLKQN